VIGDPLLGPGGDDEGSPPPSEPEPEVADPTRVVPAPVLPPGGLRPGSPPPGNVDPLWAATMAPPEPGARVAPPPGGPQPEPAATTAIPMVEVHEVAPTAAAAAAAGNDLAPTAAISGLRADDLTATTAMPGVSRSVGPHDTMVMPTVAAPPPGAEHAPGFEKAMRRHRRRWWRRSFKAVLVLVFLGVVYVGVNLALVIRTANTDQARVVDVIVVLGAAQYDGRPSPQLEARLEHTVDLWNEGLAPVVFVTGGNQPGDAHTEAESSRDYLVEHGVPAEAIQMEDTARSTWESLSNFAEIADGQGWERVLLVTDPFHSLRSRLIAQELGFTAYTSPTQTSPVQGREELMKEIKEALGISVGRIIGFERLWKVTG
jgi:uncharacterized SAM-binding protein YcdF (DUF218 family)